MDDEQGELPASERVVRAPGDAVESASSHLTVEPRRQRLLGDALVAALAGAVVVGVRRFRR